MDFFNRFQNLDLDSIRGAILSATADDVERVLSKNELDPPDFPVLFSAAADPYLERIAQKSAAVTERRFGKTIVLYAPLYLSNACTNHCLYCGFSKDNDLVRSTLDMDQVQSEADILYNEGFRQILLVSGESPKDVGFHYLTAVIRMMHERFASTSIEIYPLDTDGYRLMVQAGVDGLALYQETYDPKIYAVVHPKGPKRDFPWRLDGPDRGGQAGFRSLGLGSLLGISDWRFEAVMLALHGRYLTEKYWRSRVSMSFPRMRGQAGGYVPEFPVGDSAVVRMLCGLRLILPDAEMVLSTREQPEFRDNMIGLGVTRMSAGSKTSPGGYGQKNKAVSQFDIEDARPPDLVAKSIYEKGHEPVWKDFDRRFIV